MNVTREVVLDLWPLYAAGEASESSRTLIEEYLRQDPELAARLRAGGAGDTLPPGPAELAPDAEARAFERTRRTLQGRSRLRWLAMFFTCLTLAKVLEDAPWRTASPRPALIAGCVAAVLWIVYWFAEGRTISVTVARRRKDVHRRKTESLH